MKRCRRLGEPARLLPGERRTETTASAGPRRGSGLVGRADRVEALAGKLHVTSAPGAGTTLHVALPLDFVKAGDAGHSRTG
jgi:signal transduction histidine kinase